MAQPDIEIEVWAEQDYDLPNALTKNKIRPISDLWDKGYDMGEKPDAQGWNYVWFMLSSWLKYMQEEQLPGLSNLYLQRNQSLSDLMDLPASRQNLGVYSKAETDDRYLQLTGGALSGGLKVAGSANTSLTTQGLILRWNETNGSGASFFVNNQGGGAGGFVFRNVNADGTTETGRLTITGNGSLVTQATVRGGSLESTGNATVAGSTTTANLVVNNNSATVAGKHVARSVNGNNADANGNITISFPAQGIMGIRFGAAVFRRQGGPTAEFENGHVLTGGGDFGADDGSYYSRPLQYLIDGNWQTAAYTTALAR